MCNKFIPQALKEAADIISRGDGVERIVSLALCAPYQEEIIRDELSVIASMQKMPNEFSLGTLEALYTAGLLSQAIDFEQGIDSKKYADGLIHFCTAMLLAACVMTEDQFGDRRLEQFLLHYIVGCLRTPNIDMLVQLEFVRKLSSYSNFNSEISNSYCMASQVILLSNLLSVSLGNLFCSVEIDAALRENAMKDDSYDMSEERYSLGYPRGVWLLDLIGDFDETRANTWRRLFIEALDLSGPLGERAKTVIARLQQ